VGRHAPGAAAIPSHRLTALLLVSVLAVWGAIMAFALDRAALPPERSGTVAAVFPPGWTEDAVFASVLAAGAAPIRRTWFGHVWLVHGSKPGLVARLEEAGAWSAFPAIIFRPIAIGGCFSGPLPLE